MDGCKNYFRHDAVAEALNIAFDTLQARMHDPGKATEPLFCVVDEWSGFISFCQKKVPSPGVWALTDTQYPYRQFQGRT